MLATHFCPVRSRAVVWLKKGPIGLIFLCARRQSSAFLDQPSTPSPIKLTARHRHAQRLFMLRHPQLTAPDAIREAGVIVLALDPLPFRHRQVIVLVHEPRPIDSAHHPVDPDSTKSGARRMGTPWSTGSHRGASGGIRHGVSQAGIRPRS